MSTRTTWVPLHTILVERDGQQVDAYAEYQRTGKAFKFTEDEVKEILAMNEGNGAMSLRSPTDEVETDDGDIIIPAASNETPKTLTTKGKTADKDADL